MAGIGVAVQYRSESDVLAPPQTNKAKKGQAKSTAFTSFSS